MKGLRNIDITRNKFIFIVIKRYKKRVFVRTCKVLKYVNNVSYRKESGMCFLYTKHILEAMLGLMRTDITKQSSIIVQFSNIVPPFY